MQDIRTDDIKSPGQVIREKLEANNWSQVELAEIMGRHRNLVYELILGKRALTPEVAKDLGEAFGNDPQYWMNLESAYQLANIQKTDDSISRRSKLYQKFPIKDMVKRNWIEYSENIDELESNVMQFYGLTNLDQPIEFPHASRGGVGAEQNYLMAWIFRAKNH